MKGLVLAVTFCISWSLSAQLVPSNFEQIDYLVTFGASSSPSWGDEDHNQVFFFVIPKSFTKPIYIRVFDPDVSGTLDEKNGSWDTLTRFRVIGGKGTHSHPDAKNIDPKGKYDAGQLLDSKTFGVNTQWNNKWYTFGPFNPLEGEYDENLQGHVFKIVAEGIQGNDGNLYKYFLSTQPNLNREVEGANAFTYEYSIRLPIPYNSVAHLYPFIDKEVTSITQHNFDYDGEGVVMIYTIAKNRHKGAASKNKAWAKSTHNIVDAERNTTMDIQIVKKGASRNDMVCYVTNQYDEAVAFFSVPVGGPPKFKYQVNVNYKKKGK